MPDMELIVKDDLDGEQFAAEIVRLGFRNSDLLEKLDVDE